MVSPKWLYANWGRVMFLFLVSITLAYGRSLEDSESRSIYASTYSNTQASPNNNEYNAWRREAQNFQNINTNQGEELSSYLPVPNNVPHRQEKQENGGGFLSNLFNGAGDGNRRSILSTLMAPFRGAYNAGMDMFASSIQGCVNNNSSMWCRFWGMFTNIFKK